MTTSVNLQMQATSLLKHIDQACNKIVSIGAKHEQKRHYASWHEFTEARGCPKLLSGSLGTATSRQRSFTYFCLGLLHACRNLWLDDFEQLN